MLSRVLLLASVYSNLVQGWDCAALGASAYYISKEFGINGASYFMWCLLMIVIGFLGVKLCLSPLSDWVGRRPLLIVASLCYLLDGLLMIWSHDAYMVLIARLVYGIELGSSFTLVSTYFLETEPPEFAFFLLPFLANMFGIWFSCAMIYGMVLTNFENWRVLFVAPSVLSLAFFVLIVVYLPETPKWLVSKGRTDEAKRVLQQLRGTEDVSYELELLVMTYGVDSHSVAVQETDEDKSSDGQDHGPQESLSVDPEHGEGQMTISIESRQDSTVSHDVTAVDPPATAHSAANGVHEEREVSASQADTSGLTVSVVK